MSVTVKSEDPTATPADADTVMLLLWRCSIAVLQVLVY